MKNSKLVLTLIATTFMAGSFAAHAESDHNGSENVQKTKSYQNFIQSQHSYGEVKSDNSVFQNHESNH